MAQSRTTRRRPSRGRRVGPLVLLAAAATLLAPTPAATAQTDALRPPEARSADDIQNRGLITTALVAILWFFAVGVAWMPSKRGHQD